MAGLTSAAMDASQHEEGKIFVGGLSWETKQEGLRNHFSQFGDILDVQVMVDSETGNPRGFGFVKFLEPKSVQAALAAKPHVIDNKIVDPKLATVKGEMPKGSQNGGTGGASSLRIFVGGIPANAEPKDLENYFNSYVLTTGGKVDCVDLKKDTQTHRMRGFGFIDFSSELAVQAVLQQQYHTICGKSVEVKKALSKKATTQAQTQHGGYGGQQQMYGGAGGGYRGQQQQQQQQQQQGYPQHYNYGNYPGQDYYAAAYANYSQQYNYAGRSDQYTGQQQTSAPPQQMGAGSYGGQDSTGVARSVGYSNPAAASTTGFTQYGQASGYDQAQANPVAGVTPYQQQSYHNNQGPPATYTQSTGARQQYYQ